MVISGVLHLFSSWSSAGGTILEGSENVRRWVLARVSRLLEVYLSDAGKLAPDPFLSLHAFGHEVKSLLLYTSQPP